MRADFVGKLLGALVVLVSLGAEAGDPVLDKVQAVRSDSFRACASVLLGYDPYARTFDRGKSDEYRQSLARMAEVMAYPGLAEMKDEYASFAGAIGELESSQREVSVVAVNHVLAAQAKLIAVADTIYAGRLADAQAVKSRVHDLSLASGKLLILYQIRPYGGLVSYAGAPLDENTLPTLDAEMVGGLAELRVSVPEASADLDSVQRNYEFIRGRILGVKQKFVADGVNYYFDRNMRRLDELAGRL